jgi:hypothetical protein
LKSFKACSNALTAAKALADGPLFSTGAAFATAFTFLEAARFFDAIGLTDFFAALADAEGTDFLAICDLPAVRFCFFVFDAGDFLGAAVILPGLVGFFEADFVPFLDRIF